MAVACHTCGRELQATLAGAAVLGRDRLVGSGLRLGQERHHLVVRWAEPVRKYRPQQEVRPAHGPWLWHRQTSCEHPAPRVPVKTGKSIVFRRSRVLHSQEATRRSAPHWLSTPCASLLSAAHVLLAESQPVATSPGLLRVLFGAWCASWSCAGPRTLSTHQGRCMNTVYG